MLDRNYKKILFGFTYLFLIVALCSCSWYRCKATGKLSYSPIYTKENFSKWGTKEQFLTFEREILSDRTDDIFLLIKSLASKEYLIFDLKTDKSNETIDREFISQIEIEHNRQTNIITINIPHQRRDSRIANKLIDNLIYSLLYKSSEVNKQKYNRLKERLEKSDRKNKFVKQLINEYETRMQSIDELESNNEARRIGGDFEIIKLAKTSCPVF